MRLHTDTLNDFDFYLAARVARVEFSKFSRHGSRSRDHAFDVTLTGESRRRPNAGIGSGDHIGTDDYAATWDQWGVFLSVLFDLDPSMTSRYYTDREHFHDRTADRFNPGGILPGRPTREQVETPGHAWSGAFRVPQYANLNDQNLATGHVYRVAGSYWPTDAHGDHTFRFAGVPFEQSCTKCSARQIWGPR